MQKKINTYNDDGITRNEKKYVYIIRFRAGAEKKKSPSSSSGVREKRERNYLSGQSPAEYYYNNNNKLILKLFPGGKKLPSPDRANNIII